MRIAVYGGSFNPPHVAHQMACLYALATARVERVWMMPSFQHPFAKRLAPFADRVDLCRAAARPFGERVEVVTVEAELREGRTLMVMRSLLERFPEHQFALVVGTDTLAERHKWYGFNELEALVPLVVVPRQGVPPVPGYPDTPALPAISSTEVRERLRLGQDCSRLVPHAVLELIAQRGLYRE